jgi:hypothetical protein
MFIQGTFVIVDFLGEARTTVFLGVMASCDVKGIEETGPLLFKL